MSILVDIFEFCCLVNLFFSLSFVRLQKKKRFLKEFNGCFCFISVQMCHNENNICINYNKKYMKTKN